MPWNKEEDKAGQPLVGRLAAPPIFAAETLRSLSAPVVLHPEPGKPEERISVFWRVFGGTLLSIAALVCITVYQQLTGGLNELRAAVNNLNEARGDLVKKDEFNARITSVWNGVRELQSTTAAVTAAKERLMLLEQQLKTAEDERKELGRELQKMRERLAAVEGRPAARSSPSTNTEDK